MHPPSSLVALLVLPSIVLALPNPTQIRIPPYPDLNPYPDHKRVVFRADGTLRLTVFSDLHFGENPWDNWGPEHDAASIELMKEVLINSEEEERPDYVVINGDLVTGENTFKKNATDLIDEILGPLVESKIPFSCTHGNHDNSNNITHFTEIEREQSIAPLQSFTRIADPNVGGEGGPGNYWVPIYLHDDDRTPKLILWFFDSRGCVGCGDNSTVPDYVDETVAEWIAIETAKMDHAWGTAEKLDRHSVAFVHIPPHAIQAVQKTLDPEKEPGQNADELGVGSTQDAEYNSRDNAFWDSLNTNVHNLRVVISGHDHGNEWCAREPTKDVIFCFDKHSGYGGYTSDGWGYGIRHLVFNAENMAAPQTWIWLRDGAEGPEPLTRANVTLDEDYGR